MGKRIGSRVASYFRKINVRYITGTLKKRGSQLTSFPQLCQRFCDSQLTANQHVSCTSAQQTLNGAVRNNQSYTGRQDIFSTLKLHLALIISVKILLVVCLQGLWLKAFFKKQTSFTQISSYRDNKVNTVFSLLCLFASLYVIEYTSGGEGEVCFIIVNRKKNTELKKRQLHVIGNWQGQTSKERALS